MLPVLLISKNKKKVKEYIAEQKKKLGILDYNLFTVSPLKTEIVIEQIRELKKELVYIPQGKRLVVLYSFDNANLEAQNAFLKTLEEKNDNNHFILVCQNKGTVLPTILSRCTNVSLDDHQGEYPIRPEVIELLTSIHRGNLGFLAHETIQKITREDALVLIDQIIVYYGKNLVQNREAVSIIKKALQLKGLLKNNNLNPQLTIDSLLIFIEKQLK